jgi:hypothetical protein
MGSTFKNDLGMRRQRRYDMNGRSQMQGGKKWISEIDKFKPVLLRLSLAGNLEKPLMPLYGTEWRERGYGRGIFHSP